MEHRDLLILLAEIGIALAGFGSLVVVLSAQGLSDYANDRSRVLGVVENGLLLTGGVGLAFLPALLSADGEPNWRASSAIAIASLVVFLCWKARMFVRLFRGAREAGDASSMYTVILHVGLHLVSLLLFLGAAFSLGPWSASSAYVAALFCPAIIAGNLFRRIVARVARQVGQNR